MQIIDLSHPITGDTPGAEIRIARRLDEHGWNATTLELYSHCGTHMDAPRHFLPDGNTLDQQRLDVLVGPARVVDLSTVGPRELITVEHLADVSESITAGARLLLRTDWSKRYGTPAWRNELPRISLELAEWLVDRRVALIGVEPPSVADVNNLPELTEVHQTLFRGEVVIVEGLTNLDQITATQVDFIALPLKVAGGDGSPVRAIAIQTDSDTRS